MFISPMDSLSGYGEVIKRKRNLDTSSEERCGGDLIAAVIDYMIGKAWGALGLFPEEEIAHREGVSIMENQTFLGWAMRHLIQDMEWNEEDIDDLIIEGIKAFNQRQEELNDWNEGQEEVEVLGYVNVSDVIISSATSGGDTISRIDLNRKLGLLEWYHITDLSGETKDYETVYKAIDVWSLINVLPSVEPEIIRCGDCRFWQDNNDGYPHENCKWNKDETPDEDDFCSNAERITNG